MRGVERVWQLQKEDIRWQVWNTVRHNYKKPEITPQEAFPFEWEKEKKRASEFTDEEIEREKLKHNIK